ncbi:MAG: SCO family protein [Acetobacteraceae bacterium]|nr:SCO family protein [Acetobacteraceae bacterium]
MVHISPSRLMHLRRASPDVSSWLLLLSLLVLVALGLVPAFGQPDTPAETVQLHVPNVLLLDQDGVRHRFAQDLIRGKVTVVSFVFTGCSTICSPVGANMGALDKMLGPQVGAEVSLVSVTLDPFNDTPTRLAAWRRQFDDGPGWRLLTGDPDQVTKLLHAMRQDTADITRHDAFLWLGDPRSETWTRVSALASPDALAAMIRRMEQK